MEDKEIGDDESFQTNTPTHPPTHPPPTHPPTHPPFSHAERYFCPASAEIGQKVFLPSRNDATDSIFIEYVVSLFLYLST